MYVAHEQLALGSAEHCRHARTALAIPAADTLRTVLFQNKQLCRPVVAGAGSLCLASTPALPFARMAQLEHIEAIEKRLWNAADTMRANSNYASNEYFMPVMGLIFLRHAYSRYLAVKDGIEANLPKRGGKSRPLTKEDFSQKGAIFLRPEAQFDYLVSLPDSAKRDRAIQHAMDTIEEDYDGLKGVLPRGEYSDLDNDVLGQLLRTLNPEELKQASGDIFGRI